MNTATQSTPADDWLAGSLEITLARSIWVRTTGPTPPISIQPKGTRLILLRPGRTYEPDAELRDLWAEAGCLNAGWSPPAWLVCWFPDYPARLVRIVPRAAIMEDFQLIADAKGGTRWPGSPGSNHLSCGWLVDPIRLPGDDKPITVIGPPLKDVGDRVSGIERLDDGSCLLTRHDGSVVLVPVFEHARQPAPATSPRPTKATKPAARAAQRSLFD